MTSAQIKRGKTELADGKGEDADITIIHDEDNDDVWDGEAYYIG